MYVEESNKIQIDMIELILKRTRDCDTVSSMRGIIRTMKEDKEPTECQGCGVKLENWCLDEGLCLDCTENESE